MSIGLIAPRKAPTTLHDHDNAPDVPVARQVRTLLSNPNSTSHPPCALDDGGPDRRPKWAARGTNQWRGDVSVVRGRGIKLVVPGRGGRHGSIAWHADRKTEPKMINPGSLVQRGLVLGRRIPVSLYGMSNLSCARSTRSAVWRTTFSVHDYAYLLAGTDRSANADLFAMLRACCASQPRQILTCCLSSLAASVVGRSTCPGTETETSP